MVELEAANKQLNKQIGSQKEENSVDIGKLKKEIEEIGEHRKS